MSFALSFLLGGAQAYNERVSAKAAAEAKDAEHQRALEMEQLKQQEATQRALQQRSLEMGIDASNTAAEYSIYQQEAQKWNEEFGKTPGAKRAVATMKGLEFVDVVSKKEKADEFKANRLSPVQHLLPDSNHDARIYPIDGDVNAYNERIRNATSKDELPVIGEDFYAFGYPVKGGAGDTRADLGLREATDFLFRDGNLRKFIDMADNGNPAPLQQATKDLKMFWRNYAESDQAKMKIDENTYVIQTIMDYDPAYMSELAAENPEFFEQVVMPTISDAVELSANDVRRMHGLPTNGPVDIDEETLRVTVNLDDYAALAWAVKDGAYTPEFKSTVQSISSTTPMTETEVFRALNSMGTEGSRIFTQEFAEAQKWYSENTPYTTQDGQLILATDRLVPPNASRLNDVLANFDSEPQVKHDLLTAAFSGSLIDKLPGRTKGGKITAQNLISKSVTGDDVIDHTNRVRASTNIINQVDLLVDLIEKHGVKGGISAEVLMTVPGLMTQFEAILDSVNLVPFSQDFTPINPAEDGNARREFENLRAEVKAGMRSGNVDAEKMYKAVTRALMYNVASMLQGGDFRNISDYDVRLAGDRMAGIMGMAVNLESSVPALMQLREEADFMRTVSAGFSSGNLADVAASAYMFNQRGQIRMEAGTFLNRTYGTDSGASQPRPSRTPTPIPPRSSGINAGTDYSRTPIDPSVPIVR